MDGAAAENTLTRPEDEPPRKKPKVDIFDFKIEDDGSDAEEDRSTLKTSTAEEFEDYLSEQSLARGKETSLEWWAKRASLYPHLAKLAKQFQ